MIFFTVTDGPHTNAAPKSKRERFTYFTRRSLPGRLLTVAGVKSGGCSLYAGKEFRPSEMTIRSKCRRWENLRRLSSRQDIVVYRLLQWVLWLMSIYFLQHKVYKIFFYFPRKSLKRICVPRWPVPFDVLTQVKNPSRFIDARRCCKWFVLEVFNNYKFKTCKKLINSKAF